MEDIGNTPESSNVDGSGIEKIGIVYDISVYYDKYQPENNLTIGRKEGKINFVVGNSKDLDLWKNITIKNGGSFGSIRIK